MLRHKSLDRILGALDRAVGQARGALLAGNLIAFVIGASLFNALWSWNKEQVARRAQLASFCAVLADAAGDGSGGARLREKVEASIRDQPEWIRRVFSDETIELSYLSKIEDGDLLLAAARKELEGLLAREEQLDRINLPFIGVDFAATDRTVIGAMAMAIVAFWMIGALHRQVASLGSVMMVRRRERGRIVYALAPDFTLDELRYALVCADQAASFSAAGSVVVGWIKRLLFVWPPASIALSCVYVVMMGSSYGLLHPGRALLEVTAMVATMMQWLYAWRSNRQTEQLLMEWHGLIDRGVSETGE